MGPATPVVGRVGLGGVGADHARPGRCRLAGRPAAPGRLPGDGLAAAARQHPLAGGGGERGHGRGATWQPPPGAPGGLAAARPRAAGGGQRRRLRVRQLWAADPARGAPRRRLPGRGRQRHPGPVVGLRQLCPAAYPHRVAALAALALVGQGGGRRTRAAGVVVAVDPQPLLPEHPEVENPLAVPVPTGLLLAVAAVAALIVLASLVAAAGALVVRFRHARGVERQQLRWLALGAAVSGAVALLVGVVAGAMAKDSLVLAALGTCVALLPLATGASILRYRLYDLDRIISRTLAYGLLTVLLGGGYAGVVLGLGQLLGRDSSLVVAAATLAVAAAFQPARRRIQRAVD